MESTTTQNPAAPPLTMNRTACTSCHRPIAKLRHHKTGGPAPFDPAPAVNGNISVNREADTYQVITDKVQLEQHLTHCHNGGAPYLYVSHFVTCPNAAAHRRK